MIPACRNGYGLPSGRECVDRDGRAAVLNAPVAQFTELIYSPSPQRAVVRHGHAVLPARPDHYGLAPARQRVNGDQHTGIRGASVAQLALCARTPRPERAVVSY